MSQHFLLTAKARTLSLAAVARMTETEAETMFAAIRWDANDGKPICPQCGSVEAYECRRPNGSPRWRCQGCKKDFTLTSGTLFAFHKLPLRTYLLAIVIFCNEVKGKSALALSRDLDVQYKTAFVMAHKLREAMAADYKGVRLGGEGKTVEVDGAYFGGYVKPANYAANRVDRRLAVNQNGKRQVVVVIRQRGGRTLTSIFKTEAASQSFIRSRVDKGTTINADEASSWNDLNARYAMRRINHQEAYSRDGACTNGAEEFFSRLRRGELGHHHHIAGIYLTRYAQEAAWREDNRRSSNGDQLCAVAFLAARSSPSVDFCGYWQRSQKKVSALP